MHPDAQSLAEQLAAIDPEPATPRDTQAHLIASLTEQFAAGQSETLYSLHTAGADLRRQAQSLQEAVAKLPDDLAPALRAQFATAAQETAEAIEAATQTLSTRLGEWEGILERATAKHQSTLDEGATMLAAAGRLMTAQTVEAVEQIEFAATRAAGEVQTDFEARTAELTAAGQDLTARAAAGVAQVGLATTQAATEVQADLDARTAHLTAAGEDLSAKAAEASRALTANAAVVVDQISAATTQATGDITKSFDGRAAKLQAAVRDSQAELVATVISTGDQVTRQADALTAAAQDVSDELKDHSRQLGDKAAAFAADARASADAVTTVGENIIARLIEVLDVRDQADKALEDRLNARIDRLTKRAETTVNRLIGALADEADVLRAEAQKDRESHAQQLTDLIDRLLAQPRGKLKDLRNDATKETQA